MIRTQILKHLSGARSVEKGESDGDVRRGARKKSKYVRIIEQKEVRRDDLIEYFLPMGVGRTFLVSERVMAIEVPQNKEISGGGKNGGRKGVGSVIRQSRVNWGSINIKE